MPYAICHTILLSFNLLLLSSSPPLFLLPTTYYLLPTIIHSCSPDDVAVGRERVKLAGLLYSAASAASAAGSSHSSGALSAPSAPSAPSHLTHSTHMHHIPHISLHAQCLSEAAEAVRVLEPLVPPTDADLAEARHILSYCHEGV
jgi:hypothetical protein